MNQDAHPRIRGRRWMEIRQRIMSRDCGICQPCKRNGKRTIGTQVDHVIALANNGSNDDSNLETICHQCHAKKTDADLGHKHRQTIGADGWPIEDAESSVPVWKRGGYR